MIFKFPINKEKFDQFFIVKSLVLNACLKDLRSINIRIRFDMEKTIDTHLEPRNTPKQQKSLLLDMY